MVILRDATLDRWRVFEEPLDILTAHRVEDVIPALSRVERECVHNQRYAAGFISYEAAPAFDPALHTKVPDVFPLLWFGIFDRCHSISLEEMVARASPDAVRTERWEPSISRAQYLAAFSRLQELIRNGETYQVNFTYRLRAMLASDPFAFFVQLAAGQQPPFGAYVDTGDWVLCSASPELFFQRDGATIESRPMKGTAARGLWFEQDVDFADRLGASEKERAENVMIVDMVRNDLGRVARPGSVRVSRLFDVERYPTVLQMTSTVAAETDTSTVEAMRALFPPASITGAPKARTMDIIAEMECSPRRAYTGTIGFVDPAGRAQFNVAIRTVIVNRLTRDAEYGIGGGIVADSDGAMEFEESRLKSRSLAAAPSGFDLLETMLWTPDEGWRLLLLHLRRLSNSAEYFRFHLDLDHVRAELDDLSRRFESTAQRVRMILSRAGAVRLTASPHDIAGGFTAVTMAATPIDPTNPFLYHKTTNRTVYEDAIAARPGFRDVILYNDAGEVTETTIANIVVEMDGSRFTPPIECGLLPGTARAQMLADGAVTERRISVEELRRAGAVYLVNSVRGLARASIVYDYEELRAGK